VCVTRSIAEYMYPKADLYSLQKSPVRAGNRKVDSSVALSAT
jgi:hypothetical protein